MNKISECTSMKMTKYRCDKAFTVIKKTTLLQIYTGYKRELKVRKIASAPLPCWQMEDAVCSGLLS